MPLFGKLPVIGESAPNFSLEDQDGNLRSLVDYKEKRLVVYFFPKAFTPG
ncbi:MAG: redoxin domain-containing protein [Candidatus Marinimicrobia bacterium]|nr:redoxin domain-containing protein [Candidatus Neomarinimicrobiota bacterium]MBT7516307.1 redoxin domain-containing protein [Candidatus Neomarinimicrobiota bacterium]